MLKVTAGEYKGKQLETADDLSVRPTKNRTRMAMLNSIESRLHWQNMKVVDLCCGSGALGIEALSRGAAHCMFVDINTKYALTNLKNLDAKSSSYTIQQQDAATYSSGPFDVIFADPPYGENLLEKILENHKHLGEKATLWALEEASSHTLDVPEGFTLHKYKTFGKSAFWLLEQL